MQKTIYKKNENFQAQFTLKGHSLNICISSHETGADYMCKLTKSTLPINMINRVQTPQELFDLVEKTDGERLWVSDEEQLMIPVRGGEEDVLIHLQLVMIRPDGLVQSKKKVEKTEIQTKQCRQQPQININQHKVTPPTTYKINKNPIQNLTKELTDLSTQKQTIQLTLSQLSKQILTFKDTITIHLQQLQTKYKEEKKQPSYGNDSEELINSLFVKNQELNHQIMQLKESFQCQYRERDSGEVFMMKEIRLFPKVAKHTHDHPHVKEEPLYQEEEQVPMKKRKAQQKEKSSSEPSTYNQSLSKRKIQEPSFGFSLHSSQKAGESGKMKEGETAKMPSTEHNCQGQRWQELQMLNMVSSVKISELEQKVRQLQRSNELLQQKMAVMRREIP